MNRILRRLAPPAVFLTALASLTGCQAGASSGAGSSAPYSPGSGAGTMPMMPTDDTDPAKASLQAARPFDLGPMVVDGSGYTVYRYDRDTSAPPRSVCVEACAQKWTPVRSSGEIPLTGIDRALVGKVTRADGSDQVTLAGWPLYRYAEDRMPGETSGQGTDRAWYPVTPDGHKIETTQDTWRADAFRL
ncbi:hypothetical protein ACFWY9_00305 [Amycolatopsis sp. NPDC059027]|uniref:hypothetical protein n=1 Tax=Amycolatopsis sp. NPDC059027 TaxID=3346709 RepID=UPI00366AF85B